MPDNRSKLILRIGQILMTVGASLAILGVIRIHLISDAFWSHWINGTLFVIGLILAVYATRRASDGFS